jgi:hypothetical protein
MSTKNLARTVIEGGRRNGSDRRCSNQSHRAQARGYSSQLVRSVELDDALFPQRKKVHKAFDDKLGPARRWLASKVGRSWHKARSELFMRFDIRTTAGRHIVFDHLLADVAVGEQSDRDWGRYRVDAQGVLRANPDRRTGWGRRRPEPLPEPREAIEAWLAGRWVMARGERLFWLEPTEAGFFRQAKALSPQESQRWLALPQWYRDLE